MPGVADQIRRTALKAEQQERKKDMTELMRMVKENRLHEADERQLETLRLSLELNKLMNGKQATNGVSTEEITKAVQSALTEALKHNNLGEGVSAQRDLSRPGMKHVSLGDLFQGGEEVEISHDGGLSQESQTEEDLTSKLKKLKKLKGNG